jgi:hypothetical protein
VTVYLKFNGIQCERVTSNLFRYSGFSLLAIHGFLHTALFFKIRYRPPIKFNIGELCIFLDKGASGFFCYNG